MAVIHDYYCPLCDEEQYDQWSDAPPVCCDRQMKVLMCPPKHFEWGGPRTYLHLRDEPFSSKSELNSWAKERGLVLSPTADKHGGSRNDMYENVGKAFSYRGAPTRSNSLFRDGLRRH